jgi:hypothetical protein
MANTNPTNQSEETSNDESPIEGEPPIEEPDILPFSLETPVEKDE